MTIYEAVVLGAVQGLTEFLPVSSSGHLVLLQKIFRIEEPVLLFDTFLHLGTLVAVCTVLGPDLWRLIRKPIQRLTGLLILGTLPMVAAALLCKDKIEEIFSSAEYLGFAFLFTGLLLFIAECWAPRSGRPKDEYTLTGLNALVIGIFQAVAIIPGVSRSGATLSGALVSRLQREFGAKFSFLLSIPAILGALVLQIRDLFEIDSGRGIDLAPYAVGTVVAGAVGFFSVKLMLAIIRKHGLWGFALYAGLLGALILTDQYGSHIFF
ncbi:MAG: undecaprenyl-diphosphate phosphatase [Spirochaetaceae bacterium]|jgi:undecaprenyl-diphosphatase|nr:undecaprenyl-diphosphate phosphatase [Spirochaetaceae bacterium]